MLPIELAVDPVTNKIYVANYADGTMTMIDGATNQTTTTLAVGNTPGAIEANVVTNKVYVANYGDNTVSVIAGANAAPLQFVAVTPCRLVDTRPDAARSDSGRHLRKLPHSARGRLQHSDNRGGLFAECVGGAARPLGYLTIWPTGEDQPLVATLNSIDGRIKADAAIVPAGYQGAISIYVTNTTNVILDINGYFAPVSVPRWPSIRWHHVASPTRAIATFPRAWDRRSCRATRNAPSPYSMPPAATFLPAPPPIR